MVMDDFDIDSFMDDNFDIDLSDLDLDFSQNLDIENEDNKKRKVEARAIKRKSVIELRRINGEKLLSKLLGEFNHAPDISYHIISGGDIDSLSFASYLINQQDHFDYFLFSTWCMSISDVETMDSWLGSKIKRVDGYVGEIFKSSYAQELYALKKMVSKCDGRIACFRNHAKIFLGWGDKFCFIVESSANINTNPRTENFVISFDPNLFFFYKDFFDGINPFNYKDFPDWKPYAIKRPRLRRDEPRPAMGGREPTV